MSIGLNDVVLIGRLTKDPEIKFVGDNKDKALCKFTLAYDYPQNEANFIDVITWGQQAQTHANNLTKGRLVAVEGKLKIRQYQNSEGQKRINPEIVASFVQYLDRATQASNNDNQQNNKNGNDEIDGLNLDDFPF